MVRGSWNQNFNTSSTRWVGSLYPRLHASLLSSISTTRSKQECSANGVLLSLWHVMLSVLVATMSLCCSVSDTCFKSDNSSMCYVVTGFPCVLQERQLLLSNRLLPSILTAWEMCVWLSLVSRGRHAPFTWPPLWVVLIVGAICFWMSGVATTSWFVLLGVPCDGGHEVWVWMRRVNGGHVRVEEHEIPVFGGVLGLLASKGLKWSLVSHFACTMQACKSVVGVN